MYYRKALCAQQENVDQGTLQITVHSKTDNRPVENALVRISYTGDPNSVIEEVRTDSSGNTPVLQLKTPPLEYSLNASEEAQPYAEYSMQIKAEDFHQEEIAGTEVLPAVLAKQPVLLNPRQDTVSENRIVIPPHTLFYEYPPKIQESEIKPVHETGEIVLSKVVIPEYIVVHDGPVGDNSASNYYVRYRDYIKNVASSEIYATWPDDTIRANILAIMSFTLNRVYTEWYRNKGKDYTITSSTAYDHKWIRGRNIFDSIDRIVDELFENYLSRPNVRQPILTQYCDGERVQCRDRGWMTQWGSKRQIDRRIWIMRLQATEQLCAFLFEYIALIAKAVCMMLEQLDDLRELDVITVKSRMILIQIDHPEVGVIEIGDARFLDGERDDVEQYGLESAQFFQFHGITSCHDHYCLFFDKRKVLTYA